MAYTTINKSTVHFNTKLYTGNGGTNNITGVGFKPDMNWCKTRTSGGYNHAVVDIVRGVTKIIRPNLIQPEATFTNALTSFNSDGFSLGADSNNEHNKNGDSFVSWNFKAGGSQGSSNTAGSINTAYTSVNTTAGFSISSYTGNGTAGATFGHGLGAIPSMVIVKKLDSGGANRNWQVYHGSLAASKALELNGSGGSFTAGNRWNSTAPTNTLFSLGNADEVNRNTSSYIAYCFTGKTGYSKFGTYKGNSDTDGAFVYTGFKVAFVLLKRTDGGDSWVMLDNKRNEFNPTNKRLLADSGGAETTVTEADFFSNGFKLKQAGGLVNGNGNDHIYMAFAEAPLVGTNNVPATAR